MARDRDIIGKFVVRNGTLIPSDEIASDIAASGGVIFLSMPDQRSAGNHRLFFSRIKAFTDAADESIMWNLLGMDTANVDTRTIVDLVRKALLIDCGYVEQTIITHHVNIGDESFPVKRIASTAKSISFDSMGEAEFIELLQCITARIRDTLISAGWDSMDVENLLSKS